ncbi:MAG TPA: hypothetical protein VF297_18330 [Pyrinomonadaceae bacterium]
MLEIDLLISEKEKRAQELRAALASVELDLQALRRTRALMRGESDTDEAAKHSRGRASIADLAEAMLHDVAELHADEILQRLREAGVETTKQAITATLSRYHAKGRRFKRTGANKFALREAEENMK